MSEFTGWLASGRQFWPGLAAGVALAVAVVAVPLPDRPQDDQQSIQSVGDAGALPGGPTAPATAPAGPGRPSVPGSGPTGSVVTGPAGPGPGLGGSTGGTGSPGATAFYTGVTATTVKWGYAAQQQGCGAFDQGAAAAAYGSSSTPAIDYPAAEEYFNKYPLLGMKLPPEIRANVNAKTGYWGRKIISVFRDSGGLACADIGRANAVTMAEKDKVFGLVMRGNEGPEVPMSLVMAQRKRIFIGRQNVGPSWFKARAPYFFDGMWGDGEPENLALGSWVCRDWVGKKATSTGDLTVSGQPRKFGMLLPDVPGFHELADILAKEVGRCGLKPGRYAYPFDLSTLEASANTVVSRMHQEGITTVLMITDFLTPLLLSKAATQQQWHPEWVRSGFGLSSYGTAYRTFMTPDQAVNAWAAADGASIASPAYHDDEAYRAWKKVRPNAEPDGDWPAYYYQFKVLAMGMAGAGRDLTPTTFAQGLARVCSPCPRSDARLPLNRLGPGKYTHLDGFTLIRYNPNKPDPTAPPDSTGNQPMGYFDFLENGKRYGLRISDPAP